MAMQKPDVIEFFAFLDEELLNQPEYEEIKMMTSKALSMCTPLELVTVLNIFSMGLGIAKEKQWNESSREEVGSEEVDKMNDCTIGTQKVAVRHKTMQSERLLEIVESLRDQFNKALNDMKLIDEEVRKTQHLVNSKEVASA
tara:strand:- start:12310 stop:12735 length:426 start_codon:yes stop_codon:yes gene_type:complete